MTTKIAAPSSMKDRIRARLERDGRGSWVEFGELIDACYPDPDKMPENPLAVIAIVICHMRAAGIQIERQSCYRLPPRR